MTTFKTLLLASVVGLAGLATVGAQAGTYVNSDTGVVVKTSPHVRGQGHVHGRTVASESVMAVGTRKVGLVGGRPYPIVATHAETTTVRATPRGLVERTSVTNSGEAINLNSKGGAYYTESDGSYYADPAFNVDVYSSGSYND